MTGECCDPEGYWRGEVRHPSAACGGTSPCRGGFGGLRRGRGAAEAGMAGKGGKVRRGHIVNLRRRRFAALCGDARLLRRA